MSFSSWGGLSLGAVQNLDYISSLQTISLVPYGNTIELNLAGGGSSGFQTITCSTLTASGTIASATATGTTATYSTMNTSSLFIDNVQVQARPISTIGINATNFPGTPSANGTIPSGGGSYDVTQSFSVNTSHYYRISIPVELENAGTDGYTTLFMNTAPVVFLCTATNANTASNLGNAAGCYSAVFKPNASTHKLQALNTGSNGTGMTIPNNKITLEDLGVF